MQVIINQAIRIPFTSVGLATGRTTFTPSFLLNGVATTITGVTYSEIGGGLYTINFTPTASGNLSIFIEATILPILEVVSRDTYAILQDLSDEALGSWSWNKATGSLSLIRQNGTALANFNVVDTISTASRERI